MHTYVWLVHLYYSTCRSYVRIFHSVSFKDLLDLSEYARTVEYSSTMRTQYEPYYVFLPLSRHHHNP